MHHTANPNLFLSFLTLNVAFGELVLLGNVKVVRYLFWKWLFSQAGPCHVKAALRADRPVSLLYTRIIWVCVIYWSYFTLGIYGNIWLQKQVSLLHIYMSCWEAGLVNYILHLQWATEPFNVNLWCNIRQETLAKGAFIVTCFS